MLPSTIALQIGFSTASRQPAESSTGCWIKSDVPERLQSATDRLSQGFSSIFEKY